MSTVKTRLAVKDDLDQLTEILIKYREFYGVTSRASVQVKNFLRERIEKGDSKIFIASEESENRITGFIQLYPSFSTVALKPQWILNDFYVLEEERKKGIGSLLMNAVKEYFKDSAKGFILVTEKSNLAAKQFYSKHGWNTGVYDFYTYSL